MASGKITLPHSTLTTRLRRLLDSKPILARGPTFNDMSMLGLFSTRCMPCRVATSKLYTLPQLPGQLNDIMAARSSTLPSSFLMSHQPFHNLTMCSELAATMSDFPTRYRVFCHGINAAGGKLSMKFSPTVGHPQTCDRKEAVLALLPRY
jgi:hypothetical protein